MGIIGCHFQLKGCFRLCTDAGLEIGYGRFSLLRQIEQTGSISQAAKSLGISYRKAWALVKHMNEKGGEPLVIQRTGGYQGGGAELTPFGTYQMIKYGQLKEYFEAFIKRVNKTLNQNG